MRDSTLQHLMDLPTVKKVLTRIQHKDDVASYQGADLADYESGKGLPQTSYQRSLYVGMRVVEMFCQYGRKDIITKL